MNGPESPTRPGARAALLGELVDSIGTDDFSVRMVRFLNLVCRADFCTMYELEHEAIEALTVAALDGSAVATRAFTAYMHSGHWRIDPLLSMARAGLSRSSSSVVHAELTDPEHVSVRRINYPFISDRIQLCGRRDDRVFALNVVTTQPRMRFDQRLAGLLEDWADPLLSIVAKHASLAARPCVSEALADPADIERCVLASSQMSRREAQVCARVLWGMSSQGVAVDLGLSEESVKTYRKRAYQRLAIGCQRELLQWYLNEWSRARA